MVTPFSSNNLYRAWGTCFIPFFGLDEIYRYSVTKKSVQVFTRIDFVLDIIVSVDA